MVELQKNSPSRKRDELEFLPAALEILETPPRPAGRLVAFLISAFFLTAILWAIYGSIDTVAVAEGKIVPGDRVKVVQPLETAIIRAIHVRDGQSVKKGDLLIELDPTETQANTESLRYDLMKAMLDEAGAVTQLEVLHQSEPRALDGKSVSQGKEQHNEKVIDQKLADNADQVLVRATNALVIGELEKHQAEIGSFNAQLEEQDAAFRSLKIQAKRLIDTIPIAEDRLQMLEGLMELHLTQKPLLLQARQIVIEKKAELASTKEGELQIQAKIRALERKRHEIKAAFRALVLERRTKALRQIATLSQQLKKEQRRDRNKQLTAPVDGTIIGLSVHTVGAVVNSADILARIVPSGSPLEIEAFILNKDIGFVKKDQSAEIKLEAFSFTRYGLVNGWVKRLEHDAMQDERRGLVYKAVIGIEREKILIGDKWVKFTPGMAAQVEIKTGERKIIEFFLSPFLKYQDEALRER